jgi:hypothetical protein
VESLAHRPASCIVEELGQRAAPELLALLRDHATRRWRLKVHFARRRLERLGWEAACHHAALEILGYRFNRAAMLRVAGRFPLAAWTDDDAAELAWAAEQGTWSRQGVRPANQPRARLGQYAAWVWARPDWPARLAAPARAWPRVSVEGDTRALRREHDWAALRATLTEDICASVLGGSRFDTLVCDGWLPLLAARENDEARQAGAWFHWPAGDLPPLLAKALRELAVFSARQPACNGFGQGLLGWYLEREATALLPLGRGA